MSTRNMVGLWLIKDTGGYIAYLHYVDESSGKLAYSCISSNGKFSDKTTDYPLNYWLGACKKLDAETICYYGNMIFQKHGVKDDTPL